MYVLHFFSLFLSLGLYVIFAGIIYFLLVYSEVEYVEIEFKTVS